jgi:hypothetical protein
LIPALVIDRRLSLLSFQSVSGYPFFFPFLTVALGSGDNKTLSFSDLIAVIILYATVQKILKVNNDISKRWKGMKIKTLTANTSNIHDKNEHLGGGENEFNSKCCI